MSRTALIAGATGLVGKKLLTHLLKDEDYNRIIIMNPSSVGYKNPKIKEYVCDFMALENAEGIFDVDDVFCCIGKTYGQAKEKNNYQITNIYFPKRMAYFSQKHGCKNFLVISGLGADSSSISFPYRVKGEMEKEVLKFQIPTIHIYRPSLITGKRKKFRLSEFLLRLLLIPFFRSRYKPIKADKLAASMADVAKYDKKGIHIIDSWEI